MKSAEDVYKEVVEDAEEAWLYGLVTFAVFEERRISWMRHRENTTQAVPTAAEIEEWYEQQPPSELLRAKGEAENALRQFIDQALEEVLARERAEAREGVIVSEIRLGRKFWPQFGVNLAGGLAAAACFAVLLIILATVALRDPSPVKIGLQLIERSLNVEGSDRGEGGE